MYRSNISTSWQVKIVVDTDWVLVLVWYYDLTFPLFFTLKWLQGHSYDDLNDDLNKGYETLLSQDLGTREMPN